MTVPMPEFPPGFQWGVATSAYQIEGAATEDGRGPSIWDVFSHEPGRIADGSTGDVACDHYHRVADDVALMADLGIDAYRFSVAWPRIQPTGAGPVNAAGIAFYDRLVDALLARGIAPVLTLYHWDLPQALQEAGGWAERATAERFGEYAGILGEALGDRVELWLTLNEPYIHLALGHVLGIHAPGQTGSVSPLAVAHHLLLGHGRAVAALRAASAGPVGITNNYSPAWAVGPDETRDSAGAEDHAAAAIYDLVQNRLFTEPVLLGEYPAGVELLGDPGTLIQPGDLTAIAAPLDVLGVNYYAPSAVGAPAAEDSGPVGLPFQLRGLSGYPRTGLDWVVAPDGLRELLVDLRDRYGDKLPPIWITENGCAYPDAVEDDARIGYLDGHLRALRQAMDAGVDVRGYLAWSLLDNWEWAEGFGPRFGLVHVDYATQARTPRASFAWYRDLIARTPR